MCDPLTILTLVGSIGSTLFGATASKPPAPEMPAAPAPTARTPGATVRLGDGPQLVNTDPTASTATKPVKERAAGTALGGLGKSTLAL